MGHLQCMPPYGPKCSQFCTVFENFGKSICLEPPGGLASPPMENPGSAPESVHDHVTYQHGVTLSLVALSQSLIVDQRMTHEIVPFFKCQNLLLF